MKKVSSFIVILISIVALWGCQKKPAAVVNGEPISEEQLQSKLKLNIAQHDSGGAKADPAALRKAVLDQMISELLLFQGALEAGITVPEGEVAARLNTIRSRSGEAQFQKDLTTLGVDVAGFTKMLRERMLKEKFVERLVDERPITEEHLREFYKNSPTPFIRPSEGHVRFIQFVDKAKAEEAMQLIKEKEESFDAMADRLDKNGGAIVSEYSWVAPGFFSPTIRDALKSMKEGSVEGPIEGKGGIYIFRLSERRPEKIKSYEEAKEDIRRILREEKKASVVLQWVAAKRKNSMITVN